EKQKWWLANGQAARVGLSPPPGTGAGTGDGAVLNPSRPSNPFTPTDEPDRVSVRGSASKQSLSSMARPAYGVVNRSSRRPPPAGTPGARRLPPAYDPGSLPAKVGRMGLGDEMGLPSTHAREVPPPPLPRRQTGAPAGPGPALGQGQGQGQG